MAQDPGEIHTFLGWELEAKQLHLGLIKHHWKPIFRQLNLLQGALERQCGSPCRDMRFGLVCKLCLDLKAAPYWTTHGPQASGLGSQRQHHHPSFATGSRNSSAFVFHVHMYTFYTYRWPFISPSLAIESNRKRKSLKVGTGWLN